MKFLIVASGWNCEYYVKDCIDSIHAQTYKDFNYILINDASTDGTGKLLGKSGGNKEVYHTATNMGLVASRAYALSLTKFEYDVIVWLDLDDRLTLIALEKIAEAYTDPDVWLTYGSYIDTYGRKWTAQIEEGPLRQQAWKFIPLRTFRKELYFKLSNEDLFPAIRTVYPDANVLFSLMEMAEGHTKAIGDVLYVYRDTNPLHVVRRFPDEQREVEIAYIRSLPPKKKLESL